MLADGDDTVVHITIYFSLSITLYLTRVL